MTEQLIAEWKRTKAALTAAQDAHLQSEINLYNAVKERLPKKGRFHAGDVIITTGYSEKWQQDKLNEIHNNWHFAVPFPCKREWKPDAKQVSYIRDNLPEAYKALSESLELKEQKPAFTLKTEK